MRYFLLILLFFCMVAGNSLGIGKRNKYRGLPRDEVGLMNNVIGCLSNKDSTGYYCLFPPFDTLWAMVMHNPDHSPETIKALNHLKEHPQALLEFDPYFNHQIMGRFYNVLKKGEDSGIHWKSVVMQRYELYKEEPTRKIEGYDKIAPERFKGYMFIKDILGRLTFCITITEIQKISGYFFGGQVINILEASDIDQYLAKEKEEKKYFDWLAKHPEADSSNSDSLNKAIADSLTGKNDTAKKVDPLSISNTDEDASQTRKEVIDRKYYEGKFDDEIPVKLFIRYMKDGKTGKTVAYDGLYKFGDQKSYVKLSIVQEADGKWVMDDELPLGSMELMLKNRVYTGTWLNNENQTGYDVVLTQTVIPPRKLEQLDNILEKGLSGRIDEESFEVAHDKKTEKSTNDDKGKEKDKKGGKDDAGKEGKGEKAKKDAGNSKDTKDSKSKDSENESRKERKAKERKRKDDEDNDKVKHPEKTEENKVEKKKNNDDEKEDKVKKKKDDDEDKDDKVKKKKNDDDEKDDKVKKKKDDDEDDKE